VPRQHRRGVRSAYSGTVNDWSTVAFSVFLGELVVLGALIPGAFAVPVTKAPDCAADRAVPAGFDPPFDLTFGEKAFLDISSGHNESIVRNIDTTELVLIALMALPAVLGVSAVGIVRALAPIYQSIVIALVLLSLLACFVGFVWRYVMPGGASATQDGIIPRRFLADYAMRGELAVADAIRALNIAGERNAAIRRVKRRFAVVAFVCFFLAALIVIFVPMVTEPREPSHLRAKTGVFSPTMRRYRFAEAVHSFDMEQDGRIQTRPRLSAAVLALGLEYANEDGVTALPPDRRRPAGFYTANHYTGLSDVPADASEPVP
jgi:hypothetical protein